MRSPEFTSTVTVIPVPHGPGLVVGSGGCGRPDLCVIPWFKCHKRTLPNDVIFLHQAGHVTH